MKKQKTIPKRIVVPKFATEAEEADWWYKNRELHGKIMLAAARRGETKTLTRELLLARIEGSKNTPVTIRFAAGDIALARRQAERKGLPYQTYIKSLLHESLAQRERKTG